MPIVGGPRETIADLNASVGITSTILLPTSGVFNGRKIQAATIQPKTESVCVVWDGSDATTSCLTLAAGDTLRIEGYENLVKFRAINAAAGDATLLVIPEYWV